MDILHLVDRLETMLSKGWRIPFTSNMVVQEDAFLDIIDQMRMSIPEEVKQAKRVAGERERLIEQAQLEAARIVGTAHEQIEAMIGAQEVVKQAEQKAQDIRAQVDLSTERIRTDADTYVMDVLSNLEEELLQLITTVRNGIHKVERSGSRAATAGRSGDGEPARPGGA